MNKEPIKTANPMARREFLAGSARTAAGLCLGAAGARLLAGSAAGAETAPQSAGRGPARSPNEKVVLGIIGTGGRGSGVIMGLASQPNVEVAYVCDAHRDRGLDVLRNLQKKYGYTPRKVEDLRRVLEDRHVDAVLVSTPEHWHALATIWACQAGKDVYVEKNISMTPWEGRKMVEAARHYGRVVQCGTQNRSAPYAFSAREFIRSGKLGKIVHVKVYNMLPGPSKWAPQPDAPCPASLNWDLWQGPAKAQPFNPGRFGGWGSWWDYGGGTLSGDASHQLDLTRMVLGDPPHPRAVYCKGGRFAYDDHREIPDMQAITYDFGDFIMTCENGDFTPYLAKIPQDVREGDKFPVWPQTSTRVEIYGTKAMMYLGRHGGGWQVLVGGMKVTDFEYGRFPDRYHQPNFIECIRSRKLPNADVEQGHLSACLVHLGNLSYRVGNQYLLFDGQTEKFLNCDAANALLRPEYRKDFRIPDTV